MTRPVLFLIGLVLIGFAAVAWLNLRGTDLTDALLRVTVLIPAMGACVYYWYKQSKSSDNERP